MAHYDRNVLHSQTEITTNLNFQTSISRAAAEIDEVNGSYKLPDKIRRSHPTHILKLKTTPSRGFPD